MKKIHARQLTLKNIHATAYKRKEFDSEQKFLQLQNSPPPANNFFNFDTSTLVDKFFQEATTA